MILNKIANHQDFYVDYKATLKEAIAVMNFNGDGSVVLLDSNKPVAILTQSDIVNSLSDVVDISLKAYTVATAPVITVNENRPIDYAFTFFNEHNIRRIVLVDDSGEFIGVVLQESLFNYMEENVYKIDLVVSHIMDPNKIVVTVDKSVSLHEASQVMKNKSIGSVIVVDGSEIVGILTEKDILKIIYKEINIKENIQKYMSSPVIKVQTDTLVVNTISIIKRKNIRRILVVDSNNKPLDILNNHDILKHLKGKRQEREYLLMQQSKLATMGEMIGHIAHQWRQPLAQLGGVFMNLDSAYEFDELNQKYLKDKVQNGNELIKYMSSTIEDFRNFFMPNNVKEFFDVSVSIDSAYNIIRATLIYHNIKVKIIAPQEPISLFGYPNDFSQVILNILDNAKDILVERNIKLPQIVIETKYEQNHMIISIKDNGGGIDKDIVDRLFDIHFTTKNKAGGSGLGLYISKLIIENKFMGDIYASNCADGGEFFIKIKVT